jgi:hypothetical protein
MSTSQSWTLFLTDSHEATGLEAVRMEKADSDWGLRSRALQLKRITHR